MRRFTMPLAGVAAAILVTTALDANGLAVFSALVLLPLGLVLWRVERLSRAEMGLVRGTAAGAGLVLAHPPLVLGLVALAATAAGAIDPSGADWGKTALNVALMSTTGVLMGILTEEGFFRGWLWASLKRAGLGDGGVLAVTSVVFSLWHVSAVTLDTGFDIPLAQVPQYLVCAAFLGAIWGLARLRSGSILLASVGHALWNGLDYPLFGFGRRSGALGIEDTAVWGPEIGIAGLVLNGAFLALALRRGRRGKPPAG